MLGGAIPGLGIIASIRNQDEQGMMCKPVNSILHDLCMSQVAVSWFLFCLSPALASLNDEQ